MRDSQRDGGGREGKTRDKMAEDETLEITVSYSGREKRIPLSVRPSLELSDVQVDQAELELSGIVSLAFGVPTEVEFCLHEAESGRILTKESFRDPSFISSFPRHWYLTVEKGAMETAEDDRVRMSE